MVQLVNTPAEQRYQQVNLVKSEARQRPIPELPLIESIRDQIARLRAEHKLLSDIAEIRARSVFIFIVQGVGEVWVYADNVADAHELLSLKLDPQFGDDWQLSQTPTKELLLEEALIRGSVFLRELSPSDRDFALADARKLAAFLATRGQTARAREILDSIQEYSDTAPDVQ